MATTIPTISMTPDQIYSHFYADNPDLINIIRIHSQSVARKALECAGKHNLDIDLNFVEEAALLHDIGIGHCNAPSISCFGHMPYICHGIEGRKMLDDLGMPRHALVCERHTGAGLTVADIIAQDLPLPHRDMLPVSLEEKLICYADKFFSKSGRLEEEKSLDKVIGSMRRHGQDTLNRFMTLHEMFG